MKIGLFDSGLGGTTILAAVKKALPDAEYKYLADSKNCPYGEKSDAALLKIVRANVETLKNWGAKIIVVACNTATTRCISYLRRAYPELSFVGTEPAVKLAAASEAKNILVMATHGTIHSERLRALLEENRRPDQTVHLLACPGLADLIEKNYPAKNFAPIADYLEELFRDIPAAPEVIVLGCTHYPLIKAKIQSFFPQAILLDGAEGVAHRVVELSK